MTKYLAGVLSVIAVGVLLIAYGLLNPRASMDASVGMAPAMQPVGMSEPVAMRMPAYAAPGSYVPYGYGAAPAATAYASPYAQPLTMTEPASRPAPVSYVPAPRRSTTTRYVERRPARDWKRTAMIIGGSSATGAGVGAMIGGKKGALIGAALGGGASTLYETLK